MITLNKIILGSLVGSFILCGCSSFNGGTTREYIDPKTNVPVTEKTAVKIKTFFDGKSGLTKLKNSITPATSGTSVGDLNQETSGTNAVHVLRIIVEGAGIVK